MTLLNILIFWFHLKFDPWGKLVHHKTDNFLSACNFYTIKSYSPCISLIGQLLALQILALRTFYHLHSTIKGCCLILEGGSPSHSLPPTTATSLALPNKGSKNKERDKACCNCSSFTGGKQSSWLDGAGYFWPLLTVAGLRRIFNLDDGLRGKSF